MQAEMALDRKIIISSDITSDVAHRVIEQIMEINDFDKQMSVVSTYQPEPIEMFINSGGGSVSDGFAIIGAMEMSETPIVTYGLGMVGSMALGIFVKGDIRIAHRHTRFMFHSIAYGLGGFIKDHEDAHIESNILLQMYNSLFKETNLTKEAMRNIKESKTNYFFSGKEAVQMGIADEVILKPEKKVRLMTEEELAESQKNDN